MTYKICQVIFSTNRLEYLHRTLEAQKNLDFEGCEVHKIFIDDFPKGRNDIFLKNLVESYGYKEVYLHPVNLGLSVTWSEFWNLIRDRDYDYIWHQEDDVEILEPVKITDLIELMDLDPYIASTVLTRQAWYPGETDPIPEEKDLFFKNFRYNKESLIFSPMASLYPISRVRFDYHQHFMDRYPNDGWSRDINYNEGMVGKALWESQQLIVAKLKNSQGKHIVNHIGDYFVGKRVLPHEPHYEMFAGFDPEKRYNSRTGREFK